MGRSSKIEADGGERGIRYLEALLESATYRFYVAPRAIRAIRADDHCTLLHARRVTRGGGSGETGDGHGSRRIEEYPVNREWLIS